MRAYRAVLLLGLLSAGCTDPLGPGEGALRISLSVVGMDGDPDGYTFTVNGRHPTQLSGPGSTTLMLNPGRHTVAIQGLVSNCSSTGGENQQVSVSPSDTAVAAFDVECHALTGVVEVAATTDGADLDFDGYQVSLDGGPARGLWTNGVIRFTGVSAGSHTVTLSGIAANCSGDAPNPRTGVQVSTGGLVRDTAHVAFDLTCSGVTGALKIVTATTGAALDADGYRVSVTPGMNVPRRLFPNDSVVVWGFPPGNLNIAFWDVAQNCTLTAPPPTRVTVAVGDTVDVRFWLHCTGPGTVRVTTTTSGPNQDTSYDVTADGAIVETVPANGVRTFDAVVGAHSIGLTDLADNCAVTGTNPVAITLTEGDTTDVAFSIACVTPGTVRITAPTSGQDPDQDYLVAVDGGTPIHLPADGLVSLDLAPGSRSIELTGIAFNCVVGGSNPIVVNVTAGVTTDVSFAVTCTPRPRTGVDIIVTTTGSDPDDFYDLGICNGYCYWYWNWQGRVPANGVVQLDLPSGDNYFNVWDVAGNCTGPNAGNFTIQDGQVTTLRLDFTCDPLASARVTAPTTGPTPGGHDYYVEVDSGSQAGGVLAPNGTITLTLAAGSHSFELTSLPLGCTVSGANPATVNLPAGAVTDVTFPVSCTAPGVLFVSASTTGTDPDQGYGVEVDGIPTTWFSAGTTTSIGLTAGSHSVRLTDVAPNCTVTSSNPVAVMVPSGATTSTSFTVSCAPNPILRATVSTTGPNAPGTYLVGVDLDYYYGYLYSATVGSNGTVSFSVPPGNHYVTLDQVPLNCSVTSPNNILVTVPMGTTTDVAFAVACQ